MLAEEPICEDRDEGEVSVFYPLPSCGGRTVLNGVLLSARGCRVVGGGANVIYPLLSCRSKTVLNVVLSSAGGFQGISRGANMINLYLLVAVRLF
jgi:hypothetical protein